MRHFYSWRTFSWLFASPVVESMHRFGLRKKQQQLKQRQKRLWLLLCYTVSYLVKWWNGTNRTNLICIKYGMNCICFKILCNGEDCFGRSPLNTMPRFHDTANAWLHTVVVKRWNLYNFSVGWKIVTRLLMLWLLRVFFIFCFISSIDFTHRSSSFSFHCFNQFYFLNWFVTWYLLCAEVFSRILFYAARDEWTSIKSNPFFKFTSFLLDVEKLELCTGWICRENIIAGHYTAMPISCHHFVHFSLYWTRKKRMSKVCFSHPSLRPKTIEKMKRNSTKWRWTESLA